MKKIAPVDVTVEDLFYQTKKPGTQRKSWYLDKKNIRPKKQFRWTLQERATLYKMRITQGKSIPEIQKYFRRINNITTFLGVDDKSDKFSRTRLHNQIRMVRGSFNGLCHQCREPLKKSDLKKKNEKKDPSLGLCSSCSKKTAIYKRDKRKNDLARGLCPICVKNKLLEGHATCIECLSSSHRYRYLDGLCGKCGEKPLAENSISLCEECLDKNKKNSLRYRCKKKLLQII
jgi:hypothetical protein